MVRGYGYGWYNPLLLSLEMSLDSESMLEPSVPTNWDYAMPSSVVLQLV